MTRSAQRSRPTEVAFDIIGTVFELEVLRPRIEALGLPAAALEGWNAAADRDAIALAATGDYQSFSDVQAAALDGMLAEQTLDPPDSAKRALLNGMAELEPRDGADEAFMRLAEAGVGIMALSNGSGDATHRLLDRAGLLDKVAHIISTDEVQLAKPRPEVYRRACEATDLKPAQMALVAAHSWDIQGAAVAGLTTAYLAAERPYSAVMRKPDVQAATLVECVAALLAL